MVHCPECETALESVDDIEYVEQDATIGIFRASKRYYTAECAACGCSLGSGVAGAQANGGAVAAGGD